MKFLTTGVHTWQPISKSSKGDQFTVHFCTSNGTDLDPNNVLCRDAIELMKECISRLDIQHILDVNCGLDQPESDEIRSDYRIIGDNLFPSWHDKPWCRVFCFSFILFMEGTRVNMHCISFARNFDLVPE
ncbi:hypothetical protein POM88_034818 [Heracleum sosnowskyi]|uniref:Uncharacterized protein n=1 Tax=Heracleum sosnowskyi TaxID=360622 RepID=A0AAD8HL98_9APIA|nr:hypothetical protein POM88_034818 [Heracleum sosnowskyi]